MHEFPSAPMVCEAIMLLCFGIAWPMANLRMALSRRPEGKGLGFTFIILIGYLAGGIAKLLGMESGPLAPVFWLYLLNSASVGVNLALQFVLRPAPKRPLETLGDSGASADALR